MGTYLRMILITLSGSIFKSPLFSTFLSSILALKSREFVASYRFKKNENLLPEKNIVVINCFVQEKRVENNFRKKVRKKKWFSKKIEGTGREFVSLRRVALTF